METKTFQNLSMKRKIIWEKLLGMKTLSKLVNVQPVVQICIFLPLLLNIKEYTTKGFLFYEVCWEYPLRVKPLKAEAEIIER